MDRHTLVLFIPILALSIPVVAIVMNALVKMARLRAGEGTDQFELSGRMDALEQEAVALRHELTDAHERLDFAERLLARSEPDRLPNGPV